MEKIKSNQNDLVQSTKMEQETQPRFFYQHFINIFFDELLITNHDSVN
jgi:hypothetical protein